MFYLLDTKRRKILAERETVQGILDFAAETNATGIIAEEYIEVKGRNPNEKEGVQK